MKSLAASRIGSPGPPAAALRLLSDERLARLAAGGSEAAFAAIFERHHQALHRHCHSIVGNGHDAADALQNTMVKALRALPGETRQIALRPWLYRIAHNESISLLRARRNDGDLEAARHVGDPAAASVIESRERLRALEQDLQELTERQRGALLMRELSGLAFGEVADALQVSPAAAKQSVYEARCALQALAEGRAMKCDVVRRTLSDGDRRALRGMKMRGHLRDCTACHDFQTALRERPAQLAAVVPALPLAAGAAMLQGLLGGAGHGGGGAGGGLAAGVGAGAGAANGGGALSLGALSLGAKLATVAVVAGSAVGGAVYVAPDPSPVRTEPRAATRDSAGAAGRPVAGSPAAARPLRDAGSVRPDERSRRRGRADTSPGAGTTTADETRAEDGPRAQPGQPAPLSSAAAQGARPPHGADIAPGRRDAAAGARPGGAGARPTETAASRSPATSAAPATRPTQGSRPPAPVTAQPQVAPQPTVTTPAGAVEVPSARVPVAPDGGAATAGKAPRPR
jgi:RNA polymerase sigma factor (sigma-70 family)